MSNPTPMKSAMNGGLTIEDVRQIQADAERLVSRRLREAMEDGVFKPTPTPSGDTREPDNPTPGHGTSYTLTSKGR